MMRTNNYQTALMRAVNSTSAEEAEELLCELANAVWHQGWTPDLKTLALPEASLRKAGYLLDFLASTPTMPSERRRPLKAALEEVRRNLPEQPKQAVPFYASDSPPRTNRDSLSRKWGLAAGMHPAKVNGLLDLQRRAYKNHPDRKVTPTQQAKREYR